MATTADRMTRMAGEQAAELTGRTVLGVAFVNRCGTLGAILAGTLREISTSGWDQPLSGGAAVPKDEIRRIGSAPTPLPTAFLLAVTAETLHAFAIRMVFGRVRLKAELAALARPAVAIGVHQDGLVTRFAVRDTLGQDFAFEIMTSQYAQDFGQLLRG